VFASGAVLAALPPVLTDSDDDANPPPPPPPPPPPLGGRVVGATEQGGREVVAGAGEVGGPYNLPPGPLLASPIGSHTSLWRTPTLLSRTGLRL
jgi:hypothetical protein